MDDVRVYDRALSLAEVQALAQVSNTAPVCNGVPLSTAQNTAADVAPSCTDANGNPLTYAIVAQPAHGVASVVSGQLHYVPTTGYTGPDSFTYKANDGTIDSNTATVTVTVNAGGSGPIALWTMNEASGTTRADTGSAPANTATTVGSPTVVAGQLGNALSLNGTSQHAATPDEASLDLTGAITMAAWVRPGAAATQDLISKNVNGVTDGYQLSLSDDAAANSQIVFVRFNQNTSGDTFRVNSTTQYPANGTTWIHVAATWDGTTIRLYYNGVQESSLAFAGPIATNTIPLALGAQVTGAGVASRWFDGEMDDVRVYDRALSLAEVQTLAQVSNTAPVCNGVPLSTAQNTAADVAPSCTDANGNPLTYAIVAQPAHGVASVVSGQLHYVPTAGYTGPDSFTYKANDGTVDSNTASVNVTVTPPGSGVVMVGAGDIADCGVGAGQTAALINALPTATVFTLGDNAYATGTATEYTNCYEPSWGAFKTRTYPSIGNHDAPNQTTGYFPYFSATPGGVGSPNGYYSYDQGSYWHVIVLNSEINYAAGSTQEQWLRADLAANSSKNVLAYWHQPRFSSDDTHGNAVVGEAIWDALYEFGADLVLNGHAHWYERYAPQTPDGVADPTYGIRSSRSERAARPCAALGTIDPNSVVRDWSPGAS